MEHDDEHPQRSPSRPPEEPLDVRTFRPASTELIDPQHEAPQQPRQQAPAQFRSRRRLALFLFLATCLSTFLVGMTPGSGPVLLGPILSGAVLQIPSEQLLKFLANGATFSGALLLILFCHEMGHYLQSRRYGVPATLPYFIPFPINPIGTMGAVIVQGAGVADRKSLYDIAISGPLAGLVIALPVAWWGLQGTETIMAQPGQSAIEYGDPLVLQWMIAAVHGELAPNEHVQLNALLFAGWVGIFITALNLIPIGQLDGGHILYTLIGRRAHSVALFLLGGAVAYMVYSQYYAYGLMVLLLMLMGPKHPPTANDDVPLGWFRVVLGWLTLAFIVVGFTPQPIMITGT